MSGTDNQHVSRALQHGFVGAAGLVAWHFDNLDRTRDQTAKSDLQTGG